MNIARARAAGRSQSEFAFRRKPPAKRSSAPIADTAALFYNAPYLTRLYTRLSADEMTVDPAFQYNFELAQVTNLFRMSQIAAEMAWRGELSLQKVRALLQGKVAADQVDAKMMSRAVTGHAASIGISGAVYNFVQDIETRTSRMRSPGTPMTRLTKSRSSGGANPKARPKHGSTEATFEFSSIYEGASSVSFECSLDGAAFSGCASASRPIACST